MNKHLYDKREEIGCSCENHRDEPDDFGDDDHDRDDERCSMYLIVNDNFVRLLEDDASLKTDASLPEALCDALRDIIRWHRAGVLNVKDEDIYSMVSMGDVMLEETSFVIEHEQYASIELPVDVGRAFAQAFVDFGAEYEKGEWEWV